MDWILIYNDGNNITVSKSDDINWNDAPSTNVQFLITENCRRRKAISGKDEYRIKNPTAIAKTGSLISNAEFRRTRNFMIYGDY
jgi:hypothetical protein